MEQRLQKILSNYGVASRRKAEQMILDRRVRVNGNTASLGDAADDEEDVIEVDGVRLKRQPARIVLMLNKPRGYVCTLSDEKGRKNVAELVSGCGARVYPVGRLDLNSEGLLLLTNDGELANRLTHPKKEVDKVYLVWLSQYIPGCEASIASPIEIDGRPTNPAKVEKLRQEGETALLRITIHEGRNRQIRRLCERANVTVTRLRRVAEGPLRLGDLKPGQWRVLTEEEIAGLSNVRVEDRRVFFDGDFAAMARANLCCRMGERVMILLAQFEAKSFEDLYQGVKHIALENFIPKDGAFPVKGYSLDSQLHSVPDCQAIVKKAAVDRLGANYGLSWLP